MGVASQLRRWLRREGADARAALEDIRRRGDAHLERKERELHETPEEGVARLQDEIRANDEAFEALRRQVGDSEPDGDPPPGRSRPPDGGSGV
jgi:hypothetical protein